MNGPNPVWTSARKKMNQSSPRKLRGDGIGTIAISEPGWCGRELPPPDDPSRGVPSTRSSECDTRVTAHVPPYSGFIQRLQLARRAKHHNRLVLLVFGCRRHLRLGQFERNGIAVLVDPPEMQRVPIDHDLAAADTEKAAKIDHGGAHLARAVDDDVDDMTHVLFRRAANIEPKHGTGVLRADDRDRGRRRMLF